MNNDIKELLTLKEYCTNKFCNTKLPRTQFQFENYGNRCKACAIEFNKMYNESCGAFSKINREYRKRINE